MAPFEQIKLAAMSTPVGTSVRMVCPFCSGGRMHSACMVVSRNHAELLYKCHRASCSRKGRVSSNGPVTAIKSKKEIEVVPSKLPADVFQYLLDRYGLEDETIVNEGVLWWEDRQRVLLPVRNFDGRRVGWVGRAVVSQYTGPKALTVIDGEFNGGGFCLSSRDSDTIVLVEDLFSAYAVTEFGYAAVALLGTHLMDGVEEVLSRYSRVVVALDEDATNKGAEIVRKLSYLNTRQLVLQTDIKDMSPAQRYDLLMGEV